MGRNSYRKASDTVIKSDQVVLAPIKEISDQARDADQPVIQVHGNDGVIEHIEIICTCGRRMQIHCDYGDGA